MGPLSEKFDDALRFASTIHHGHTRKGSTAPFITHPLAVCAIVGEHGGDEAQMIAALLHDAIEMNVTTREEISQRFGQRVADIVETCTDWSPEPNLSWREQKERYLKQLKGAKPAVRLVAVADKLHNVRSIVADLKTIGPEVWARFRARPEEVVWYFKTAAAILRDGWQHPLLDELEQAVKELERYTAWHKHKM